MDLVCAAIHAALAWPFKDIRHCRLQYYVSNFSDEIEDHVDVQEDDPSFHESFFGKASIDSLEIEMW